MSVVHPSAASQASRIAPVRLAERLPDFDRDGSFARDGEELLTLIGDHIEPICRAFWEHYRRSEHVRARWSEADVARIMEASKAYERAKYGRPCDQAWVDMACAQAWSAYVGGVPLTTVLSALTASHRATMQALFRRIGDDPARYARLADTVLRLAILEAEVMTTQIARFRDGEAASERAAQASLFREQIATQVEQASGEGKRLRTMAAEAAGRRRGRWARRRWSRPRRSNRPPRCARRRKPRRG